jgi:hypothetical protein
MLKSKLLVQFDMTLDEKVRYGMVALGGASVVLTALGLHLGPINIVGGAGD